MSPEPTLLMAVVFGGFLFLVVFFVGWYLILDRRAHARRRAAEQGSRADAKPGVTEASVEDVELRVTGAEALVLFEWLASVHDGGAADIDEAVRYVLWDVEAQLETKLVEPFRPDYAQLVEAAKKAVRGASDAEGE
ncbi:hypothetical protein [Microbacterium aurugineum]|uniref:hypothetical protein n=1 Tax=Microbacterium aurugineum TaxID=2851642 RepID=UPI0020C12C23|nr:hypothetical protein [Microbacterium aurugineum]MCK8476829.1 hypothetical protein [Microbacterium aurugineum]